MKCYNFLMESKKLITSLKEPKAGGFLFSVVACLPVILSLIFSVVVYALLSGGAIGEDYGESDWYLYCAFLLPQLCFAAAVVFFIRYTNTPVRSVYRGARPKYFLIAVLLQFGLLSLSQANTYFVEFLGRLGFPGAEQSIAIPSLDGFGFVAVLLVVALLPAIFEETVFRGIMIGSMKKCGILFTVFVSGALFALFHEKPVQTVYQFACGCAFALVAIRSGSVLPTILSHFLNNAFIVVLYKMGLGESFGSIAFYILSGVVLAATLGYLIFVDKNGNGREKGGEKEFLLWALVGILVCAVMWITGLFAI